MLRPVPLRDLLLPAGAHLSAASGMVRAGRYLHIAADDEHHLATLDLTAPHGELAMLRFRDGDLPAGKRDRKRLKPDLEALAMLPPHPAWPHGALFALGSGSTPQRHHAFLVALLEDGRMTGPARAFDMAALYQPLRERFADLNIEGAFAAHGRLHLLQRANRSQPHNACIAYDLQEVAAWLAADAAAARAPTLRTCTFVELGAAAGIPYGFTDGAAWPGGGWVFSAVAEDTQDSYADGRAQVRRSGG